jgi:hypothetical protein
MAASTAVFVSAMTADTSAPAIVAKSRACVQARRTAARQRQHHRARKP